MHLNLFAWIIVASDHRRSTENKENPGNPSTTSTRNRILSQICVTFLQNQSVMLWGSDTCCRYRWGFTLVFAMFFVPATKVLREKVPWKSSLPGVIPTKRLWVEMLVAEAKRAPHKVHTKLLLSESGVNYLKPIFFSLKTASFPQIGGRARPHVWDTPALL